MLTIGLVVNPCAGVGGPAGMKGSDGDDAQARAKELGIVPKAIDRGRAVILALLARLGDSAADRVRFVTVGGEMGRRVFDLPEGGALEVEIDLLNAPEIGNTTSAALTRESVVALASRVDLLVFVGGDGTARDVHDALRETDRELPVLGVPAGVKMHSGVFATSPESAARLLAEVVEGGLVAAHVAEVRDIDEEGLRRGIVGSTRYGELLVPSVGGYLQHVKSGGKEVEALVLLEIAAEIEALYPPSESGPALVIGPGSTCYAVKQAMLGDGAAAATLLGVDVIHNGQMLLCDASSVDLLSLQERGNELVAVVSFSRGQGFVLGRGNQQLCPEFLTELPVDALRVVSSRTKLQSLAGRPLLVDAGNAELNKKFSGLRSIISGYDDCLLYLVQPA